VSLNLASMAWWMDSVVKRGPEKVLHNATIVLWILFILNSVLLYLFS
jgi:preprotein translocase subunit SecG